MNQKCYDEVIFHPEDFVNNPVDQRQYYVIYVANTRKENRAIYEAK